jgi:hypothetical protein
MRNLYQENIDNDSTDKWAEDIFKYFSKEDIQIVRKYRKILQIITHQENANKNYIEIPFYIQQTTYNQKEILLVDKVVKELVWNIHYW